MSPKYLFNALITSAFLSMTLVPTVNANATTISGSFGVGGYDIIGFSVASQGIFDLKYTNGFVDPTFSLFNSSGAHLISNDDDWGAGSLYSHITQNLGSGNYSLLVSYCCNSISYLTNGYLDDIFTDTDGFNSGSYVIGGSSTLSGMQAYLDSDPSEYIGYMDVSTYTLTISAVPVPAAAWLLGSGLLGLIAIARRKAA